MNFPISHKHLNIHFQQIRRDYFETLLITDMFTEKCYAGSKTILKGIQSAYSLFYKCKKNYVTTMSIASPIVWWHTIYFSAHYKRPTNV